MFEEEAKIVARGGGAPRPEGHGWKGETIII